MPTTLIYTHSPLPPHLTHYFSGYLGTLSLGIPWHTCNATKVAGKTTVFFFAKIFCVDSPLKLLMLIKPLCPNMLY